MDTSEQWTQMVKLLLSHLPSLHTAFWVVLMMGFLLILINWLVKPLAEQYAIHKYKKVSLKEDPEDPPVQLPAN